MEEIYQKNDILFGILQIDCSKSAESVSVSIENLYPPD